MPRARSWRIFFECFLKVLKGLGGCLGAVVVSEASEDDFESHLGSKMEPKMRFFGSRKAFQDGLGHHVAFVAFSRRAGNAKIRFSYHRGAIFEGATARPKEAENRTKMVQKWYKNGAKMHTKTRSRSRSKTVRKKERF